MAHQLHSRYYDEHGELFAEDVIEDAAEALRAEGYAVRENGDSLQVSRKLSKGWQSMGTIEAAGDEIEFCLQRNKAGVRDLVLSALQ